MMAVRGERATSPVETETESLRLQKEYLQGTRRPNVVDTTAMVERRDCLSDKGQAYNKKV